MAQDRSRSFWSFAPQVVLRTTSVVLLLVSLGYLIYCSAKFGENFGAGYGVDSVLLVFHLAALARACTIVFRGSVSALGRPELGCTSLADIIAIFLAIFGGIFLTLAYARPPECGSGGCEAFRSYPAGPYQVMAANLLYAVSGLTFLSAIDGLVRCCVKRERRRS